MSVTAEKLRTELANLPESDRAELVRFLIDSLEEGHDENAEVAWDAELQRRADEILSGQAKWEAADQVFSELRDKHS